MGACAHARPTLSRRRGLRGHLDAELLVGSAGLACLRVQLRLPAVLDYSTHGNTIGTVLELSFVYDTLEVCKWPRDLPEWNVAREGVDVKSV